MDKSTQNLEVGDLVMLFSKNLVCSLWYTGRVIEIHPGKDGG